MPRRRPALSALWLALPFVLLLGGCSDDRPRLLDLAPGQTFAQAKAALESQGFVFQGREPEPFVLTVSDVDEYYTFHARTKDLSRMAQALHHAADGHDAFTRREADFINAYTFYNPALNQEVGVGFDALTGHALYAYTYVDDLGPLLAANDAALPGGRQVYPSEALPGVKYHYFESGDAALILEQDADGASGGGLLLFPEAVLGFYRSLAAELDKEQGQ
ncbi:MAG: hypothetical protein AB7D57_09380 [Desulfovibrionaceae bacterium]